MTFGNSTLTASSEDNQPACVPSKRSLVVTLRYKRQKTRQEHKRIRSSAPASSTAASVPRQRDLHGNTVPAPPAHDDPLRLMAQASDAMHKLKEERDTATAERDSLRDYYLLVMERKRVMEQADATIRNRLARSIDERNEAVEEARRLRVENRRLEDSLLQFQRAINQALTPPGTVIEIPPPSTRMQANSQVKRQLASLFEAPSKRQKRNHLIEALDKTLDEHDNALAEVRRAQGAAIRERNGALYKLNIANQELAKVESERDVAIKERNSFLNQLDEAIEQRDSAIDQRDSAITEWNDVIAERKTIVLNYTNSLRSFKAQNTKLRTAASKHDKVLKSTIDKHNLAIRERDAAIHERDSTAQKYENSINAITQERDSVRLQNNDLRCTVRDYSGKLNSRISLHNIAIRERKLAQQARDTAHQDRDTAHQDRDAAIQDRQATSKRNGELLGVLYERNAELRAVKRERDAAIEESRKLLAAYKCLGDSNQQFHATFNQALERSG
ncbi:hypothetical protein HDK77DRAFT_485542 [Phyllosticta capitalensis]